MNSKAGWKIVIASFLIFGFFMCLAKIYYNKTKNVRVEMYIYHSDGTTEGNMYHDLKVDGNTYYGKRLSDSVVFKIVKP